MILGLCRKRDLCFREGHECPHGPLQRFRVAIFLTMRTRMGGENREPFQSFENDGLPRGDGV